MIRHLASNHFNKLMTFPYIQPGEEYRQGYCNTSGNIGGHYRPFGNGPPSIDGYNVTCTPDLTRGCVVGDLTGKHATITIAGNPLFIERDALCYLLWRGQ